MLHSMASLYPKPNSPFWYITFKDAKGARLNRSTGLRRDSAKETAKAKTLCAQISEKEIQGGVVNSANVNMDGWQWVAKFLRDHCRNPDTLKHYSNQWDWIQLFIVEKRLIHPNRIKFEHGQDYIDWRTTFKKKSGNTVSHNTARLEVKLFSLIMTRAERLGYCSSNPLVRLGIRREESEEKPEITDEEFAIILPALEKEAAENKRDKKDNPAWMQRAWLVSMHTGCRLKESRLEVRLLDFNRDTITYGKPKGGRKRAFSIPMPPALKPLLKEWAREGNAFIFDFPFQPSRAVGQFLHRLGLDHLCFHCLRVTYITRLARANVPLSVAMRLVNHASTLIHRIYQRLSVEDVRGVVPSIFSGIAGVATAETPKEK